MLFRSIFALAFVSIACAQTGTNTNSDIQALLDDLDVSVHHVIPQVETLIDSHQANDSSITPQFQTLIKAFNDTANGLAGISKSTGSNDTMPSNNDIAVTLGDALSQTTTGLSALTTDIVPSLPELFAQLDPAMTATVNAFNQSAPAQSSNFVHILMADARQFLVRENMTNTVVALGYPA